MRTTFLVVGIVIGVCFSLALFLSVEKNAALERLDQCQHELESSECQRSYEQLQSRHELRRNASQTLVEYLARLEDQSAYFSHISDCFSASNTSARDNCLIQFILETEDYKACGLLESYEMLRSCYHLADRPGMETQEPNICLQKYSDPAARDRCLMRSVLSSGNSSACSDIHDPDLRESCRRY